MRTTLVNLAVLAATASATYTLEDDYSSDAFASMFDFFTDNDPTNGYVNYISYDDATSAGLYKIDNGSVYMGVDATNVATGRGRDSIRISTKKQYNHGLVILDLEHMPAGACGTWPAFWMLGPNWPNQGEIDIIEGVNSQTMNSMTLHTNAGCSITSTGAFSGTMVTDNCDVNAPDQPTNAGCSIASQSSNTFGDGFNSNGGGVYATEWTSEDINVWFFPRGSIPSDIASGNPDPSSWGLPQAQFTGGCDIDEHVTNQQLVFDVTFCGDWAGAVWPTDPTCAPKASTCQDFVQNNPTAFTDMYWLINSLQVFTENGAAPTPTSSIVTTVSQTATSTVTPAFPTTTLATVPSNIPSPTFETLTSTVAPNPIPTSPPAVPTTFYTATAPAAGPSTPVLTAVPTTAWNGWSNTGGWGNNAWQGAGGDGNGNGNAGGNGRTGGWGGRGIGGGRK